MGLIKFCIHRHLIILARYKHDPNRKYLFL